MLATFLGFELYLVSIKVALHRASRFLMGVTSIAIGINGCFLDW